MLKVRPEVAREVHEGRATQPGASELIAAAAELGATLRALHPGATDPLLAPYLYVDVTSATEAARVRDRLSRCDVVEAAYIKPAGAPP
jgi:hypothetical protein